jgi:hypothetical protein
MVSEAITSPDTGHSTQFQEETAEKIVESMAKNDLRPKKEQSDALDVIAGLRSTSLQEHRQDCVDDRMINPEEDARENDTKAVDAAEGLESVEETISKEEKIENDESDADSVVRTLTGIRQMVKKMPEFSKQQPGFSEETSQDPVAEKLTKLIDDDDLSFSFSLPSIQSMVDEIPKLAKSVSEQFGISDVFDKPEEKSPTTQDQVEEIGQGRGEELTSDAFSVLSTLRGLRKMLAEKPKIVQATITMQSSSSSDESSTQELCEDGSIEKSWSDASTISNETKSSKVSRIGYEMKPSKVKNKVVAVSRGLRNRVSWRAKLRQDSLLSCEDKSTSESSLVDELEPSEVIDAGKQESSQELRQDSKDNITSESPSVDQLEPSEVTDAGKQEPSQELRQDSSANENISESPSGDELEPSVVTDAIKVMATLRGLRQTIRGFPELVQDHSKESETSEESEDVYEQLVGSYTI